MCWVVFELTAYTQVRTTERMDDTKSGDAARRPEGGKYMTVELAALELEEGDLTESVYSSEMNRRKGRTKRNLSNEKEFREFSDALESLVWDKLIALDYLDTTERFMPDYRSSLKLSIAIQEIHFDLIKPKKSLYYRAGYVEMVVDFELKSHYGKSLIKETLTKEHGPLAGAEGLYDEMDIIMDELIEEFMISEDVKSKVTFSGGFDYVDENALEPVLIEVSGGPGEMNDWRESVATIIAKDGHGSACVISPDGYLVTNFHVVEHEDEVRVKFMNGDDTKAKVLRRHPDCDLALLKVDRTGLKHLTTSFREAELGETVYVIGTPADTLLAQSVSRGIVSGARTYDKVSLIQTDAKVNGGNSGGALVSADGKLIGVVSAKYVGFGIEGIGFAVPMIRMKDLLKVDVKAKPAPPVPAPSNPAASKGKKK
ncbi:MAG: S1C family serine protease [Flavobacteriales bacterium]